MSVFKKIKEFLGISLKEAPNWEEIFINSLSKEQLLILVKNIRYPENLEILASQKLFKMDLTSQELIILVRSASKDLRIEVARKLLKMNPSTDELEDILLSSTRTVVGDEAIEKMLEKSDNKISILITASLFSHHTHIAEKVVQKLLKSDLSINDYSHIFKSYTYDEKVYLPFLDTFWEMFKKMPFSEGDLAHILVFCKYQKIRDEIGSLLLPLNPHVANLGYIVANSHVESNILEASKRILEQNTKDTLPLIAIVSKASNHDYKIEATKRLLKRKQDSSVYRDISCHCPDKELRLKAWNKLIQITRIYEPDLEYIHQHGLDEELKKQALELKNLN
ncbi:hypothetical protein AD998_12350 [bacterium 336/3]|nr:hypothetical protein AD998_12350 [bacterium 336/3]